MAKKEIEDPRCVPTDFINWFIQFPGKEQHHHSFCIKRTLLQEVEFKNLKSKMMLYEQRCASYSYVCVRLSRIMQFLIMVGAFWAQLQARMLNHCSHNFIRNLPSLFHYLKFFANGITTPWSTIYATVTFWQNLK